MSNIIDINQFRTNRQAGEEFYERIEAYDLPNAAVLMDPCQLGDRLLKINEHRIWNEQALDEIRLGVLLRMFRELFQNVLYPMGVFNMVQIRRVPGDSNEFMVGMKTAGMDWYRRQAQVIDLEEALERGDTWEQAQETGFTGSEDDWQQCLELPTEERTDRLKSILGPDYDTDPDLELQIHLFTNEEGWDPGPQVISMKDLTISKGPIHVSLVRHLAGMLFNLASINGGWARITEEGLLTIYLPYTPKTVITVSLKCTNQLKLTPPDNN